jgi:hypothetical protein
MKSLGYWKQQEGREESFLGTEISPDEERQLPTLCGGLFPLKYPKADLGSACLLLLLQKHLKTHRTSS